MASVIHLPLIPLNFGVQIDTSCCVRPEPQHISTSKQTVFMYFWMKGIYRKSNTLHRFSAPKNMKPAEEMDTITEETDTD